MSPLFTFDIFRSKESWWKLRCVRIVSLASKNLEEKCFDLLLDSRCALDEVLVRRVDCGSRVKADSVEWPKFTLIPEYSVNSSVERENAWSDRNTFMPAVGVPVP